MSERAKPDMSKSGDSKIKFVLSEYGAHTPKAAEALNKKIETVSPSYVAKLLYDRAAEKNPGKQKDALLNISEALEKGTATEEQLSAGLKEVENLFELSTFSPIYSDNRGDFNAMRHFLKRELHSVRDAKRIEAVRDKINNGSEIDEKKINEKIGFAKGWLERGLGESLHGLGWPNTENDLVKHQKLANGLEEIRKAWTKDKEMDFKKAPRYKKLIKELFDSLKK